MTKLMEKVNDQFNFELSSGYLYLAMAVYADDLGMGGFNHFLNVQAQEEYEHAEKFYDFMMKKDYKPEYAAIEKPQGEYDSLTDMFKAALGHEQEVTRRIKAIYKDAVEEGDLDVQQFLDWFIMEQREEEDNFRTIVERMERINGNWGGLYIFDRELGQR